MQSISVPIPGSAVSRMLDASGPRRTRLRVVLTKSDPFLKTIRKLRPKLSFGQETDQLAFTGERFLPGYADGSIELEHVHRYSFAIPFAIDRTVLDIACGEGYGSDLLAQVANAVLGVDIDEASIALARKRYTRQNLSFRAGGAMSLPLEDHSIDTVVSFETIEHLEDQDAFWCEIKRVLKIDGILIVSSPNRDAYREQRSGSNPFHKRELTQKQLVAELERRFLHHRLFSQSVNFASLLLPHSVESMPPYVISVDPKTQILSWESDDERTDPYSVALASDKVIPETRQSFYTGRYPAGAMSSLMGGIVERDQLAKELLRRIAELEASVAGPQDDSDEPRSEAVRLKETLAEQEDNISRLKTLLHDRDQAILAAKIAEENHVDQIRLLTSQRDVAWSDAVRLKETLAEQENSISRLKTLLHDRDQAILAAKSVEENLIEQTRLLTSRHDQVFLEAMRVRETLADQDGVIAALKALLEEYAHGSSGRT